MEVWIEEFLRSCEARNLREKSISGYRYHLEAFAAGCGDVLDAAAIEAHLASRRAAGLSDSTIAGDYRALRAWCNWLHRRGHLAENPITMVESPRQRPRRPRRTTASEYVALLESIPLGDWVDLRDRLMITTLFLAGVRIGELCRLKLGNYALDTRMILVERGKGGDRAVPMLRPVADAFMAYMLSRPAWHGDDVFLAATGHRNPRGTLTSDGARIRLRRLCDLAGIRYLNPHSFRHGLAVHLLNDRGAQMSLIQQILGHRDLATTERIYAVWQVDALARQFGALMDDDPSVG